MLQYPVFDLFTKYMASQKAAPFNQKIPDICKKYPLELMNHAINLCEQWEHAMDIGGGNGHYLAGLAKKFKKATLVEVSSFPEHKTLEKEIPNITIFQSFIEKYSSTTKADFILLADIFEHIPDIKAFTLQLAALQEQGGVVYIMTPNAIYCGPAPESGTYHTRHLYGHIKHYTTKEICLLMNAAGYRHEALWFEEAPFRQKARWFLSGLTRRDDAWQRFFIYRIIRPLVLIPLLSLRSILGEITYRSERKHRDNQLVTRTQNLVFKKE